MPAAVDVVVLTVSVELPDPTTDVGLKLAEAPVGNPLTLKLTVPLNPPDPASLTEYVVPAPAVTVWLAGEAATLKSPAELTTNVTFVEWLSEPLVPVIVSG